MVKKVLSLFGSGREEDKMVGCAPAPRGARNWVLLTLPTGGPPIVHVGSRQLCSRKRGSL